jgi:hypothetical protein
MFKGLIVGCFLLACSVASSRPANAQSDRRDFDLVNNTPWEIYYVYARITGTSDWGDDVMEDDTLSAGDTVHIHFSGRGRCTHDIKIEYPNGVNSIWSSINLCNLSKFTVWYDFNNRTYQANWR